MAQTVAPQETEILLNSLSTVDWHYRDHPIHLGIPFPRGTIFKFDDCSLIGPDRQPIPFDAIPRLYWPDKSIKWAHLCFLATREPGLSAPYRLQWAPPLPSQSSHAPEGRSAGPIQVHEHEGEMIIDTGCAEFTVATQHCYPFKQVKINGQALLASSPSRCVLRDHKDVPHYFQVHQIHREHHGNVYFQLKLEGQFKNDQGIHLCSATCRLFFYAHSPVVKSEFIFWNPNAAKHPGGLWDLGDPGSIEFRSFEVPLKVARNDSASYYGQACLDNDSRIHLTTPELVIHQSSSGHDNWYSLAHVDKDNQPTPKFCGYKVTTATKTDTGAQATPFIMATTDTHQMAICIENFWQTFPNSLEVHNAETDGALLVASPFPAVDEQLFELQGGEKTISKVWYCFAQTGDTVADKMRSCLAPLVPALTPTWYCQSGALPLVTPESDSDDAFFHELINGVLLGENNFANRIIRFQEFGWRNFGDLPGDHETNYYEGNLEFISHYNNQYDYIFSFLLHFIRSAHPRWFELAKNLCLHYVHHDIYHTTQDKAVYNGGPFWHTYHYMHGGTATHRSYSRLALEGEPLPSWFGGGPSNEHIQTTGLLLYYLLSADENARDALSEVVQWVLNLNEDATSKLRFLSRNPTGLATCTRDLHFQGAGRGAAYSINACLDFFVLTSDISYLTSAETFIRICCHPDDRPEAYNLLDRENRWSYVVFLQTLGRYLDLKREYENLDDMFHYVRVTLINYADWMVKHEYPFLDKPSEVQYPTSTWAAQDLRKSVVFLLAAKYGRPENHNLYLKKATEFFTESKNYLGTFEDRDSVRNLVIIMQTVPVYNDAISQESSPLSIPFKSLQFKPRITFVPRKTQAIKNLKKLIAVSCLLAIFFIIFALKLLA